MKIALMQPYFLPYIGYFQLISAVEVFIIHDDVQHIKAGWVNRNRLLVNNKNTLFTLPLKNAPTSAKINEREIVEKKIDREKLIRVFDSSYSKKENYSKVRALLLSIFSFESLNLAEFNVNSLKIICDYLEIKTPFVLSSELKKDNSLTGESRVISICESLAADEYVNPIGGQELYSKENFNKKNIDLKFIKAYNIPVLSIIDVLANYSIEEVQQLLTQFTLI